MTGYVRKNAETFAYDDDGNLISDSVFIYKYDAENRLVWIEDTQRGRGMRILYDYMSRRSREIAYDMSDSSVLSDRIFIYTGLHMIAEVEASTGAVLKTFVWGTDISNTGGGAGGIAGLVMINDKVAGETYFPGYDGRGNLTHLVNADTLQLAASFEYSPFGRMTRATGDTTVTPFRYQTKWAIDYRNTELAHWPTDLYDYGLRFYNASLGRFQNRDPIGETGTLNLYAFVGNDPINQWDLLGLFSETGMAKQLSRDIYGTHGAAYVQELVALTKKGWTIKKFDNTNLSSTGGGIPNGYTNRQTKTIYLRNGGNEDAVDNLKHEMVHTSQPEATTVGERPGDIKSDFKTDGKIDGAKIDTFVREQYVPEVNGTPMPDATPAPEANYDDKDFKNVKPVDVPKLEREFNERNKSELPQASFGRRFIADAYWLQK